MVKDQVGEEMTHCNVEPKMKTGVLQNFNTLGGNMEGEECGI